MLFVCAICLLNCCDLWFAFEFCGFCLLAYCFGCFALLGWLLVDVLGFYLLLLIYCFGTVHWIWAFVVMFFVLVLIFVWLCVILGLLDWMMVWVETIYFRGVTYALLFDVLRVPDWLVTI